MVTEKEWKEAWEKKEQILKENRQRIKDVKKAIILLAKDMHADKLDRKEYSKKMLKYRKELNDIKQKNFRLVQEWVAFDDKYQDEHPERFHKKTLDELKPELEKKKVVIDKWRLEG